MYIIAIAWLYVTLLVAATTGSLFTGVISFLLYGLLPSALILWMGGSKVRRQRNAYRESLANQGTNDDNRSDSQANQ